MSRAKSLERTVAFTDAVVAIAITVLVLPLVDVVTSDTVPHDTAADLVRANSTPLLTFLLSFVVIARFWLIHHQMFENVREYNRPLMLCNLGWLLTIVVLPFPTEIAGHFDSDRFTVGLYIGTMLVSSAWLTSMTYVLHRNPALTDEPIDRSALRNAAGSTAALFVALAVALAFGTVGYFALFLLMVPAVVLNLRDRRRARA
jgi:uncharacterized membrane protein